MTLKFKKLRPAGVLSSATTSDGACRIGRFEVQHARQAAFAHRQHAGDQLDHAAAGAEIAEVTLESDDRHIICPCAEDVANRAGFIGIALGRAEAVRVDVADVGRRSRRRRGERLSSPARARRRTCRATLHRRRSRCQPDHLGVNRRTAALAVASSSSTIMPAPSPATMPVRLLSNGRLAFVGSPFSAAICSVCSA